MSLVKNQSSFSLGEVDRAFFRKVDTDQYWKSCSTAQNVIITAFGSVLKRPGTYFKYPFPGDLDVSAPTLVFNIVGLNMTDGELVVVFYIISGQKVHFFVEGLPAFQTIDFSANYTAEQLLEANFVPVASNLIILHQDVAPNRIQFNGTTFDLALYSIVRGPCVDFGTVDYFNCTPVIEIDSGNKTTKITLPGVYFPSVDDWVNGTITMASAGTNALGFGIIQSATSVGPEAATTTFVLTVTSPFSTSANIAYSGFSLVIRQQLFTATLGWPAMGIYYQDRLWLTRHPKKVLSVYGSTIGNVAVFDTGTGISTDGIDLTLDTTSGDLLFFAQGKHLELFSENAQYTTPNSDDGLTPANTNFKEQSTYALLSTCRPVTFQNYTFYAGKDGKSIYMFYETDFVSASYKSDLVSEFSSHLINSPVKMALFNGSSETLYLLAILNADKSIAIFQFNESLDINGWTQPVFDPKIEIIDMASTKFELYFLVNVLPTNTKGLIALDINDLFYLDAAIGPFTVNSGEVNTITGLDIFNGATVYLANDIEYIGSFPVVEGSVTVDATFFKYDLSVYVGYNYTPILAPLPLVADPSTVYNYRTVKAIYVDYIDTLSLTINGQEVPFQILSELQSADKLQLRSGTATVYPLGGYDQFQYATISQLAPVAWHILSISYSVAEGVL